ncbi:MAG: sugar transferase [Hyphomonadaceae bacterium]
MADGHGSLKPTTRADISSASGSVSYKSPVRAVAEQARAPANDASTTRGRPRLSHWRKRSFDFVVASVLFVGLAPVMAGIWIAIRLSSPGPGLYWSARAGRGGRVFLMPKFRTMRLEAPSVPRELMTDPEAQVTAIGRVLRRWSMDELPQLICILKGEMSFIGPRPLLPEDPAQVAREEFPDALSVRPGLSGLAQVRGRNLVSPRRKARLDALYARVRSGPFDLEIFARTLTVLVSGRGFI